VCAAVHRRSSGAEGGSPFSPLGLTSNSGYQSHNLETIIGLLLLYCPNETIAVKLRFFRVARNGT
jgi:hypothetical protein